MHVFKIALILSLSIPREWNMPLNAFVSASAEWDLVNSWQCSTMLCLTKFESIKWAVKLSRDIELSAGFCRFSFSYSAYSVVKWSVPRCLMRLLVLNRRYFHLEGSHHDIRCKWQIVCLSLIFWKTSSYENSCCHWKVLLILRRQAKLLAVMLYIILYYIDIYILYNIKPKQTRKWSSLPSTPRCRAGLDGAGLVGEAWCVTQVFFDPSLTLLLEGEGESHQRMF